MITWRWIGCYKTHVRRVSSNVRKTWNNIMRDKNDTNAFQYILGQPEVTESILKNTEISCNHMTPEIKLFLLTPNCNLYHAPFANADTNNATKNIFVDPFWSIYWPGGQALTRFILDEREQIFPSRERERIQVLDIGAGCGASAIAAKLSGVKQVLANDIDEVACTAISMNAMLNNVDIEVSRENLLCQLPPEKADIIFIGDMLYDNEIAEILIPWLEHACNAGSRIYLGDPGRHCLTNVFQKRLRLIRKYSLPENIRKENHGFDHANVWEFYTQ